MNKGLKRRFPWIHKFNNYTSEEMTVIFLKMLNESNWSINVDFEKINSIIKENINYLSIQVEI